MNLQNVILPQKGLGSKKKCFERALRALMTVLPESIGGV